MATLPGFITLQPNFDARPEDVGMEVVSTAIAQSLAEHNRQLNAIYGLYVMQTNDFKKRFRMANYGELQPLDQFGRALPLFPQGHYDLGWPIFQAGAAWGANWLTRKQMTIQLVNDTLDVLLQADIAWMRRGIMRALFYPNSWVFEDEDKGQVEVMPLANGDGTEYFVQVGYDRAIKNHSHYLARAGKLSKDNDPFAQLTETLEEHPENSGSTMLAIVSAKDKGAFLDETWTKFHPLPDANIKRSDAKDQLVGTLGVNPPGKVLGYHEAGVWITQWDGMPQNYISVIAVGANKPLAMRQHDLATLRGFVAVAERDDYPYWERQWIRMAGFGAWNRLGAAVIQMNATDTVYTSPAGFGPQTKLNMAQM
jgi:hypothetical protein